MFRKEIHISDFHFYPYRLSFKPTGQVEVHVKSILGSAEVFISLTIWLFLDQHQKFGGYYLTTQTT